MIEGLADGGTFNTFKMASLYSTANTVDNIDCYATRQGKIIILHTSFIFVFLFTVSH